MTTERKPDSDRGDAFEAECPRCEQFHYCHNGVGAELTAKLWAQIRDAVDQWTDHVAEQKPNAPRGDLRVKWAIDLVTEWTRDYLSRMSPEMRDAAADLRDRMRVLEQPNNSTKADDSKAGGQHHAPAVGSAPGDAGSDPRSAGTPTPQAGAVSELKACPFCGAEPRITERAGTESETGAFMCFVACMCGGFSARAHQYGAGSTAKHAQARAFAAWNTRVDDSLRADNARLRDGLHNVLLLATSKLRDHPMQEHLIRFCREAGVEPSILRGTPEPKGGE